VSIIFDRENLQRVSSVHICSLRILLKQGTNYDFQPFNVKMLTEDMLQLLLQQMFKISAHFTDVISICQLPHRQLSVVQQTRPHSDAAAVGLSTV